MSEADFSSTADMAEMNRLLYQLEYTEGISLQMRIPQKLKVAPGSSGDQAASFQEEPHSTMMNVPDRIVVADDGGDARFSIPRELDIIQPASVESVALKAPPRVLTLKDQPLNFLEPEQSNQPAHFKQEVHSHTRWRRERYANENVGAHHNVQIVTYDAHPVRACPPLVSPEDWPSMSSVGGILSYVQLTTRRALEQVLVMLVPAHRRNARTALEVSVESTFDDAALVDASALRRQIVKLNRRLQSLEHENKERSRREMAMYSLTAALWLINAWMLARR
ncbi:mitochondrial fission factor homolog A [Trichomycterus rosablanca]|uniref:mitochondrial fission factor homolog A n=1 Tax=Trichomycterus rosablanca TaxID=2290929 RepID=UPI002F358091